VGSISTFTYNSSSFSKSTDQNPIAFVSGLCFGTFSSSTGISIDGASGIIDLANSDIGTYDVKYEVQSRASVETSTVTVDINA
tara:strand:+ start:456 stop:704 length:249 start_codon:yes stop_codon:yes gene_type:complete